MTAPAVGSAASCWWGRHRRAFAAALAALAALMPLAGAAQGTPEAALKAALVANLALFAEWPEEMKNPRVCIAGRGETAEAVRKLAGRAAKNGTLDTAMLASPQAVAGGGCAILFIAQSTSGRGVEFAQAAAGNALLIVSEADVLPLERSHVVLDLDEGRPVIDVNLTGLRQAKLNLSARLLKLARKVL